MIAVNLIDTPGHPDFIAEVERVLRILDGAVLVVSAVEGVQPQTRVLMRALTTTRIPTLLFVNKIDREGAREGSLLREIRRTLGLTIVPMGTSAPSEPRRQTSSRGLLMTPITDDLLVETLGVHDEQLLSHLHRGRGPAPSWNDCRSN